MRTDRPTDATAARRSRAPLHQVLIGLLGLYLCGWLLAVIGISRDMRLPVDERWAASALLAIEGLIAVLWVADAYAWRRAFAFAPIVLALAFAIEYAGVATGWPFGRYHYTGALVPSVLGRVPAPITCAWLMIVLGSFFAARACAPRGGLAVTVILAAALATGLDACIEPAAFHVKAYWLWDQPGSYYGVPAVNFAGWFGAALVVTACAARILNGNVRTRAHDHTIPLTLFWSTVALFATVDFFRGYPLGAAIGAALCLSALAAAGRSASRARARPPGMTAPSTPAARAGASGSNSQE